MSLWNMRIIKWIENLDLDLVSPDESKENDSRSRLEKFLHISKIIMILRRNIFSDTVDGRSTKENYYEECTRNVVTFQLLKCIFWKVRPKLISQGDIATVWDWKNLNLVSMPEIASQELKNASRWTLLQCFLISVFWSLWKALPEAQRTHGIDFITLVRGAPSLFPLTNLGFCPNRLSPRSKSQFFWVWVGIEVYWGPITSWIDEISPPHLCIVCFITFLTIYKG